MIRLSAFADEIAADLDTQLAGLAAAGIQHLELRGVWDTNVLDLSDAQVSTVRERLAAHGVGVSAIGSPIGKIPIDSPFEPHLARFERALALAHTFDTPYIRIFSFYPPAGEPGAARAGYREQVLARLRILTARAGQAGVTLLHENEKDIYGDTIGRCVDLLESLDSAHFRAVLDPANFIQCAQQPYPAAYAALRAWVAYVHVKDARPDGQVVAAGEGAAEWPALLARLHADGYAGFFSLEPHLAAAGRFQGFSGPALFGHAAQAFQTLLRAEGWPYS